MSDLKRFISNLLSTRGNIDPKWLPKMINDDSMKIWRMAFTHSNVDSINNYEQYEFIGDTLVNLITANYLGKLYPDKSRRFLNNLKNKLVSENTLPTLAKELKFDKYIRVSDGDKIAMYKVYEDVYEAFFGALIRVCEQNGWVLGAAFNIAQSIIESQLKSMKFGTDAEQILGPISWVKEMYEKYGWPTDRNTFQTRINDDDSLTVTIWGYPKGDKTPIPANRVKIYTLTGGSGKETYAEIKRQAFTKARDILDEKWGISYTPTGM